MSTDNPLIDHWRPPPELPLGPPKVVFGALGVGKTYSARITEKEATGKEDESRE